ncbi:hypothetical protein Ddc_08271 [Ditylenchus destructor]|nr:hypothetical protein Ddc_08271 [Ditylenchus destructor]
MPAAPDYEYKMEPYCTEYARAGASTCRECKGSISEESWSVAKIKRRSHIYGIDKLEETDRKRIISHLGGKGATALKSGRTRFSGRAR